MAKNATKAEVTENDEDVAAQAGGDDGAQFESSGEGLMIDLRNVEEMKFDTLPKQIFNGLISNCEYSLSKSSGQPMWNLELSVTDEGDYQNRKQFTILSFSPKALPGTKTALATFAPELTENPFDPSDAEVVQSLIGKPVKFKIKHEDYQGEPQSRVSRWYAPEGSGDGFGG